MMNKSVHTWYVIYGRDLRNLRTCRRQMISAKPAVARPQPSATAACGVYCMVLFMLVEGPTAAAIRTRCRVASAGVHPPPLLCSSVSTPKNG